MKDSLVDLGDHVFHVTIFFGDEKYLNVIALAILILQCDS